ncbi:two component sensor kinase [alpha proteobacterium BAL199]|nr:two component sensor kinase [alpha proteobacterium BAL199]
MWRIDRHNAELGVGFACHGTGSWMALPVNEARGFLLKGDDRAGPVRVAEEKHRAILETSGDAIVLANAETGLIVEANDRAGVLFACDASELVGMHQSELHPSEQRDRYRWDFRNARNAGRMLLPDVTIQRRDGTVSSVEITARTIEIDGVLTLVGFYRDISHRKAREYELIAAREAARAASDSKTRFLANMSHELRTPLNAIIGMSELIRSELWGAVGHPKYAEYATDINDSGLHLLDLINDILDFSRVEMGKVTLHDEDIDVTDLLEQSRRTIAGLLEERDLTCVVRVSGSPILTADRRAMRQMLLNLLSNAVKHTPPGGRVTITSDVDGQGGLAIVVEDTGRGIPAERLEWITEPFNVDEEISVTRQGGAGLGLAITKRLVERHGGQISIDSSEGFGTSVRLSFPPGRVSFS